MKQHVWLIRHGLREDHEQYGVKASREIHTDDPALSEHGKGQAEEAAVFFKDKAIKHIFCSPFLRCIQTTYPIAKLLDLPIKIEYGLRES